MRAAFQNLITLTALAALTGCANISTRLPDVSLPELQLETSTQEELALIEFNEKSAALLDVAYPILRENSQLCPKTKPSLGIMMHQIKGYDKRLRASSARVLGAKTVPRIFQIASDSPAEKAGLKIGDEILNPKGETLDPTDNDFYDNLIAGRDFDLRVLRGGEAMDLTITPEETCDYNLRLKQSATVNAYADGRNITMTTGMMDFTNTRDELALIVGHELAHNTMGHVRKIIGNVILSLGATRYTRPFESEADYVGLYYSVRAGYSPENVEAFWRRLAKTNPKSVSRAKTHPTFPDRYLRLAAARDEITEKLRNDERLIPNFKSAEKDEAAR